MYEYTFYFGGRRIGAIGIMLHYRVTVVADDVQEARRALYNTHEHISDVILERRKETDYVPRKTE